MTEHTHGMVTRSEVRKEIEKTLDKTQPQEVRAQSWGAQMDRGQFERMKAAAQARKARKARDRADQEAGG